MSIYSGIAQTGSLDNTFGLGGKLITTFPAQWNSQARGTAVQNDGKIIAVGFVEFVEDSILGCDFAIARYNVDGSPDSSFDNDGLQTTDIDSTYDYANSVVIQSDGKIVVGGYSGSYCISSFTLVRYNSDGSLDSTFDSDGKIRLPFGYLGQNMIHDIALQPDGKFVVAGITATTPFMDYVLIRFNTDGSLDTTFNGSGIISSNGFTPFEYSVNGFKRYSVIVQNDGKILTTGTNSNGLTKDIFLSRYFSNGALDSSFGINGSVITDIDNSDDISQAFIVQNDGKIIVVGGSDWSLFSTSSLVLIRYNSDGSLDTSFDADGISTLVIGGGFASCGSIMLQNDGKILLGGTGYFGFTDGSDFMLSRFDSNGQLDDLLCSSGIIYTDFLGSNDYANAAKIQSDGKVIIVGFSTYISTTFAAARYDFTSVNITEPNFENQIKLFPNPTLDKITIEFNNYISNATIKIISINGQTILNQNNLSGKSFTVDVSSFSNGLYVLEINDSDKIERVKFVKE